MQTCPSNNNLIALPTNPVTRAGLGGDLRMLFPAQVGLVGSGGSPAPMRHFALRQRRPAFVRHLNAPVEQVTKTAEGGTGRGQPARQCFRMPFGGLRIGEFDSVVIDNLWSFRHPKMIERH
jgi:hypothetical protein